MSADPRPPDYRLDGPVHTWFGLSYSNYQVLHRTLMQSMPLDWQERMVACLEQLREAYAHLEHARAYIVEPAVECEYSDLTKEMRKQLGVTRGDGDPDVRLYYDRDGTEHEGWERALVPTGRDPVPHYDRGRTYIEPGRDIMTDRQLRQFDRMARLAKLRTVGVLTHGASGLPVRRPHPHARGGAR